MFSQKESRQTNLQIGETNLFVEIADDLGEQYQGLSDRESLCQNCGMLFVYSEPKIQHFVMRGMRFPLDFVFARGGQVVELVENVPSPKVGESPRLITSSAEADMVLEVNAGFVSKNGIKVGDLVSIVE